MQQTDSRKLYFGQIPDMLIKDGTVRPAAKVFFAYLHSRPGEKDFRKNLNLERNVPRKESAKELGVSERTITRWIKILNVRGWTTILYQGWRGYRIILHGERRRR